MLWRVWSARPPECMEEVSSPSMLDAARAWAERQFRRGMLAHDGTEVLVCGANDPMPRMSTCRVKIQIVNAPAFRASFAGLAFEANDNPARESGRG
jgi:hypothetical protein